MNEIIHSALPPSLPPSLPPLPFQSVSLMSKCRVKAGATMARTVMDRPWEEGVFGGRKGGREEGREG